MISIESVAAVNACYYSHPGDVVEVWEPASRYHDGRPPNRVGCTTCGAMHRTD